MTIDIRQFTSFAADIQDLADNEALQSIRCQCLERYLGTLGAKSILVEPEYTDAGYLVDYANYYARCHEEYPRTTTRLHFFSSEPKIIRAEFDGIFSGKGNEGALRGAYLGFVVLKPLPATIIGRTCLKTYPTSSEGSTRIRDFPVLRRYGVHLYGTALAVESIAFQEQDAEVAACSTTSIWFGMHALPHKFTSQEILSPYEITSSGSATYIKRNIGEVTRRFPTSGLALEQIEAYFRSHDLECIVNGMKPEKMLQQLKEAIATFVGAGLPIIVVGNLYGARDSGGPLVKQGLHALTTLGYAYEPAFKKGDWSQRLERLYAHDDNIGPFASFNFETCKAGEFANMSAPGKVENIDAIKKAIEDATGSEKDELTARITGYLSNDPRTHGGMIRRLVPHYYLVPADPKLRFPYETVYLFGQQLETLWSKMAPSLYGPGQRPPELSSSVQLLDSARYQKHLVTSTSIDRQVVESELTLPRPRMVWMLSFNSQSAEGEMPLMDIVFDATALKQSGGLLTFVTHAAPDASTFFSLMVSTLRGQKSSLAETSLPELKPVFREFAQQLEASLKDAAP